jgi:hypothetical protein
LAVVVAAVAVVLAVHGVSAGWARGLGVAAMVGFVLAVLPGLEWASALGLVALFVAVVAQVLGTDLSVTRGVLLGLALLVWALLAELGETVADSPRQQPPVISIRGFGRQAWPLLAAGAVGVGVVVLAAVLAPSLTVGGLGATVIAVASPALLAVAALLAWQWHGWRRDDTGRR